MKRLIDYLVVVVVVFTTSLASFAYLKYEERKLITEKWIPISQEKIKQLEETK